MRKTNIEDPWEGFVDPADIAFYKEIKFGSPGGLGERPAVVVIDVQKRTTLPEYPARCTIGFPGALPNIRLILERARELALPVFFAYVAPKDERDSSRFAVKFASLQDVDSEGYEFHPEVSPTQSDILLPKSHPSAFYGTPLISYLVDRNIDSLIILGATTSGCVRATAVDAFSNGFRVVVPYDGVFDRVTTSHYVNLFDMNSKYGDVVSTKDLISAL